MVTRKAPFIAALSIALLLGLAGVREASAQDGKASGCSVFLQVYETNKRAVIYENSHWFVLLDSFPARPGHALIIPKRQFESYFEITPDEWVSLSDAFAGARRAIPTLDLKAYYETLKAKPLNKASLYFVERALSSPFLAQKAEDFTIAVNEGPHAGRTVNHLHIHLVPRFQGDVEDPTGGFRKMFPGDGNYLKLGESLNALEAATKYYNHGETALAYFRKIRELRGVMQELIDWIPGFPVGAKILEVGFGPGIEFEHLMGLGYQVDGIDISHPMKIQLEKLLDDKLGYVWRAHGRLFPYSMQEFKAEPGTYDRIWAMATFLHVDKAELPAMLNKYGRALRSGGEMFINFKVGDGPTVLDKEGRPFSNFTEATFQSELLPKLEGLQIKKIWTTGNDKLGRATQWLNIILQPKVR